MKRNEETKENVIQLGKLKKYGTLFAIPWIMNGIKCWVKKQIFKVKTNVYFKEQQQGTNLTRGVKLA